MGVATHERDGFQWQAAGKLEQGLELYGLRRVLRRNFSRLGAVPAEEIFEAVVNNELEDQIYNNDQLAVWAAGYVEYKPGEGVRLYVNHWVQEKAKWNEGKTTALIEYLAFRAVDLADSKKVGAFKIAAGRDNLGSVFAALSRAASPRPEKAGYEGDLLVSMEPKRKGPDDGDMLG